MVSPEAWDTDYLQRFADAHLARYEQAVVGFVQKQDLQQARRIYEQIIQDYPEYANRAWVEYQLGRLTLIENSVEEAIKHLNNALEAPQPREYPELAALCYERLGYIAYYEQRNLRQALDYLAQAISHYPAGEPRSWLIQVYLLRARILREQNLNKAYEAAAEAVQIASNEASKTRSGIIEALFAVAEILAEMPGREDELVLVLRRFIQLDKAPVGVDVTWSRVYEMLGNAYMALLEYSQAIPAYEEALRFNPYHPWSETLQYRVAVAQYQLGQYADTVTFLRTLLDNGVETETYRIYVLLGNAQFAQGAFTEAQKSYAEALRNAPAGIDTSTVQAYYEASSRLAVPI
jgi:tetratricopeptide (TPR) repeat protein